MAIVDQFLRSYFLPHTVKFHSWILSSLSLSVSLSPSPPTRKINQLPCIRCLTGLKRWMVWIVKWLY
jgi:hypothetical protein